MCALSPDAVAVTPLDDFRLSVLFENGEKREFDVKPLLSRVCYAPLRDTTFFRRARIEYGVVTWPDNIDIDPEWLYGDSVAEMP